MLDHILLCCLILSTASAETSINGIKPTNILGGLDQHASFSFVRPGLTQTSFAFNGPSSHQSFSSIVGNPYLIEKVQPNVAQALKYRNPGLGSSVYPGDVPTQPQLAPYQLSHNPALIAYLQQQQQQYPFQVNGQLDSNIYQAQVPKNLAFNPPQLQSNHQIFDQLQLQPQEQTTHNLLGVAYSVAPSVARVKISGNGYKFDY